MIHEYLHQRRAVKIRQPWHFSDHAYVAKPLYGIAVFPILVTDQNYSVNRKLGCVQCRQRKQRVIDGSHSAARGNNHGRLQ